VVFDLKQISLKVFESLNFLFNSEQKVVLFLVIDKLINIRSIQRSVLSQD